MTAALALVAAAALAAAALDIRPTSARVWRQLVPRSFSREARAALPALVDAVAAALASGLSLPLAFAEIAPTLPASLAVATRRAAASLALGAPVSEALAAYAQVVSEEDIAPFAVVLATFARSGGRVGRSLSRVATLLRGRLALEEERAALTAQGRLSAIVLASLAPLGGVFFAFAMPDYVSALTRQGAWLLAVALALQAAGGLWLWRIVRLSAPSADLASFLDAVVVGLEAGLVFERALAEIVARAPGFARVRDARRILADLALGRSLPAALASFAGGRADEARVGALVVTASRFGAPLAELLIVQADALRLTEHRRAETTARRLPVLMLLPLTICLIPALLIVFLGPPLLTLL